MKRLLFVINVDWYFDLHWLARARYFQSQDYEVHIATHFTNTDLKTQYQTEGFICHPIAFQRQRINPIAELRCLLQCRKVIQSVNPHLIHAVTIKPNIYTGLIHPKIPSILTITGLGTVFSSNRPSWHWLKLFIISLYRWIGRNKRRFFIFENHADLMQLKKYHIIQQQGKTIKGAGVDIKQYPYSPPPNKNCVLFAARLIQDKGLFDVIEAVKILRQQGLTIKLQIAGIHDPDAEGSIAPAVLKKLDKLGIIEWLGHRTDMANCIKQADLVCLPSRYGEGVPRILIEAASCGRAIVASDIPGCQEIVQHNHNGLLVPIDDTEQLAKAIKKIITNQALSFTFSIHGRQKVINEFTQQQLLAETAAIYQWLHEQTGYSPS